MYWASVLMKRPPRKNAESRMARTGTLGPAQVELRAGDRHHDLVALIEELPAELNDAAVGLARRRPRLQHGAAVAQRIARTHRQREAPFLDARGADAR